VRAHRALILALAVALPALAADRSRVLRAEFMRENPCPATGKTVGACPGWQIDHKVPLCLGGPEVDARKNLRWITVSDHKAKTRDDVKLCRAVRSQVVHP
jgi:5-methylcytosine-specific restriction endonuclease McrA